MFCSRSRFPLNRSRFFVVYFSSNAEKTKPKASEVLTGYLMQTCEPPWTSYFVKCKDVINDQYGMSHFNWQVGQSNYTVLRVGCFPFIKYHCTKAPKRDLDVEDKFFRFIKVVNLGMLMQVDVCASGFDERFDLFNERNHDLLSANTGEEEEEEEEDVTCKFSERKF